MLMTKKQLNDYIYNSFLPDTAKRIIDETPESNTEYYDVYYIIKDKGGTYGFYGGLCPA